jgi:hypothetical protein
MHAVNIATYFSMVESYTSKIFMKSTSGLSDKVRLGYSRFLGKVDYIFRDCHR